MIEPSSITNIYFVLLRTIFIDEQYICLFVDETDIEA